MSNWKDTLASTLKEVEDKSKAQDEGVELRQAEAREWLKDVVVPALNELKAELEKNGKPAEVRSNGFHAAGIVIDSGEPTEYHYSIHLDVHPTVLIAKPVMEMRDGADGRTFRAEGTFRSGAQGYSAQSISKEEIIRHFTQDYTGHIRAFQARRRPGR